MTLLCLLCLFLPRRHQGTKEKKKNQDRMILFSLLWQYGFLFAHRRHQEPQKKSLRVPSLYSALVAIKIQAAPRDPHCHVE